MFSLIVSALAFVTSGVTAWLTLLRRGRIVMTQPTVIYFGPDGGFKTGEAPNKVYLRTLLYSTGKRGQIIENMFARLRRGETQQNFNIWIYGDKELNRGSGLFAPETGLSKNHHFLLPADGTHFEFFPGLYVLEIFITEVGAQRARKLFALNLEVTTELAQGLKESGHGLYFDWGPDSRRYAAHIRKEPRADVPALLQEMLGAGKS